VNNKPPAGGFVVFGTRMTRFFPSYVFIVLKRAFSVADWRGIG